MFDIDIRSVKTSKEELIKQIDRPWTCPEKRVVSNFDGKSQNKKK